MLTPTAKSLLRNWWPVVFWLGVIRVESTDTASAANTAVVLSKVLTVFALHLNAELVERLDGILRKTGHFVGYAMLSALVLLALRNTNCDRLRQLLRRPWGAYLRDLWRPEWAMLGILLTIVTAAFDEIHQSFIPSRTGRWQDVVLDTCGAAVMQFVIYVLATRKLKQQQAAVRQVELTTTR